MPLGDNSADETDRELAFSVAIAGLLAAAEYEGIDPLIDPFELMDGSRRNFLGKREQAHEEGNALRPIHPAMTDAPDTSVPPALRASQGEA